MTRIGLFGTCNDSQWRETLKPLLTIDYFDPVVSDWNAEAQEREIYERATCDWILYTITPKMVGVYSIAEVVDDSNKRPERTIFCLLRDDDGVSFDEAQWKSLQAVKRMVLSNTAIVTEHLAHVARFVNT